MNILENGEGHEGVEEETKARRETKDAEGKASKRDEGVEGGAVNPRWARIGELFDEALGVPPEQRETFLAGLSDAEDVKAEVRSLLQADARAQGFLEASPDAELPPDAVVGPYRITGVLGRGGMGIVYAAEDTRLHRRVALKALPLSASAEERQRHRLRQEARAAAALQHPNIATIYALEEIDGQVFIASEYLEGSTLRAELAQGPLGARQAAAVGLELARALAVAHERGIVHRDLKPENIMHTREGVLKILDFGLAQFDDRAHALVTGSRLTAPGLIVGTPPYMAPEQLLGRETDFHADHFALGILMYELATGQHPFGSSSLPSVIARILAAAPEPPRPDGGVPLPLWRIIERCLQKEPSHRFVTTRDLLTALEGAASDPALPAAPAFAPGHVSAPASVAEAHVVGEKEPAPADVRATTVLRWWRFHQFAAAVAYWLMVWPAWHIHRSLGGAGLFFFFAVLAAVVVAGNLRLHLWFSSRVYPEDLPAQRQEVSTWIRWADVAFAALLVIGGIALPEDRAGWAALFISFGIGAAVAFVFIEPATTRAAFRARAASELQ